MSVVPEKVRDVGKYIYDLAEALRSALDSTAKNVDAVAEGSWTGDAATVFATGWTEVHDGGFHIITALTGMAENREEVPRRSGRRSASRFRAGSDASSAVRGWGGGLAGLGFWGAVRDGVDGVAEEGGDVVGRGVVQGVQFE